MPIQNSISNVIKGSIINGGGPAADFSTKSLSFDGVDDYMSTGSTYSELDTQNNFTFSFWIKPTNLNTSKVVFSIGNSDPDTRAQQFYAYVSTNGQIYLYLRTMSYYAISKAGVISANVWHHVLICRDENQAIGSKAKIFVNNVDETVNDSTRYWSNTANATTPLYIGEHTNGFLTPFTGNIDEFAIWAGQDLRNDVATIYNNGKPADLTSLDPTSWYRAGENSAFSYPQILMPEDTNKDKVSKYSLAFDGTDDYISIGTNSLGITSAITVSAWVKIPTTNTGGGGTNIQVIACEDTTSGGQRNWNMFWRGTGSNYFAWVIHHTNLSASSVVTSGITPNDGQWHHLLGTYDGTTNANGIKLYVDGVLSVQGTAGSTGINAFSSSEPTIGALTGGVGWRLEGNIDEVAVWSDDLSVSANAIYNGGIPTDIASLYPTRLEGYWKLGEEAKFTDNWLVPNSALSNFSKYSFNFDGIDDYVDCGDNDNLSFGNGSTDSPFSISAWIKPSSAPFRIVFKWGTSTQEYYFQIAGGGKLQLILQDGVAYIGKNANTTISLNTWNHVLITYDGSSSANGINLYLNGNNDNFNNITSGTYTAMSNTIEPFLIGKYAGGSSSLGKIDEVAIWDSELSALAVTSIYNGGKPKDLSGLSPVSWWRMGEEATYDSSTSQFTIPDQGSGGNTGTRSNTMLLETLVGDAPQYYGGGISDSMDIFDRVGDAPVFTNNFSLDFDGVDDYVQVPNSTSLNITTALSVSAWFKTTSANGMYLLTQGSGSQVKYYIQFYAPINRIQVRIWDGSAVPITIDNTQVFDDGQWHNIVLTTDALTTTDGVKIYFDGTLLTNKGTLNNNGIYTASAGLFIGQIPNTTRFNGNIDEVALFNSELSSSDVTTIYNSGIPNDISSLSPLSWWRFEEGSGTTAKDSGSGGNDGTLINGPLYDTDRILTPKANNTVSFNMEEADIVEDTP